jgi:hypothetical protein
MGKSAQRPNLHNTRLTGQPTHANVHQQISAPQSAFTSLTSTNLASLPQLESMKVGKKEADLRIVVRMSLD